MKKIFILLGLLLSTQLFMSCTGAKVSNSIAKEQPKKTANVSNATKQQTRTKDILKKYSDKLDIHISKLGTPLLYEIIDDWMGVPYKYAGTTKKGVDCSGFVGIVYKGTTNRTIPRTTKDLYNAITVTNKLQEGDLVFFNYSGKKNSHVGIYLHNGKFVHASSSKGVMISDINSPHYKQTYSKGGPLKIGRLNKLTN